MKKALVLFLLGFLTALLTWVAGFFYQLGTPTSSTRLLKDIHAVRMEALSKMEGRKVIVAGGSNGLFGLRTQVMEEVYGLPTISMCSNIGMRLPYILDIAERYAKSGDVILLMLEELLYFQEEDLTGIAIDQISARDVPYFEKFSFFEKSHFIFKMTHQRLWTGCQQKWSGGAVSYNSKFKFEFNERGEFVSNDVANQDRRAKARLVNDFSKDWSLYKRPILEKRKAELKAFFKRCSEKGIKVLASSPNTYAFPEWKEGKDLQVLHSIKGFYEQAGVPFINKVFDFMVSEKDLYDSPYHVTGEAAMKMSRKRAELLAPYLK